jgi:CPA1 family monovalent cation:H+ antiporter
MPNLLLLGLIGLLGLLCQWVAWRIKLPAILFLLLTGILLGPTFGILDPDLLFGDLLFSFISLSVGIILFEGSLTLKRSELSEIGNVVRNMVSYGALINATVTTIAAHYFTDLSWPLAALFGAIMVVTGPTVIMPMLQSVRPNALISRTLRWEGIIIDPLGALFAVLVFEWIVAQQASSELLYVFVVFGKTIITGALLGITIGYCFGLLLRHRLIPEFLQNFAAIAFVTSTFAVSNILMHESGLLAVTIMGIFLANMANVHTRDILSFTESLTLILVSTLFIILSARINFDALIAIGWGALGVLLTMQFIARPCKIIVSTFNSNFSFNERILLSWVGPRGIVAAAITAVFALKLETIQMEGAELLVPLAFSVIIGTVLIQSVTARALAKTLKVSEPDTKRVLVIGANKVAITLCKALETAEIKTILCDTNWEDISAARMEGLTTYYGNVISDHAELHLDLTSLGGMLGLSRNHANNTTAALRFREDFGSRKIFILPAEEDEKNYAKHRTSEFYKGRVLFSSDITYRKLNSLIEKGAQIKKTQLSESYKFEDWKSDNNNKQTISLFALSENNNFYLFTSKDAPKPKSGWTIFSLSL